MRLKRKRRSLFGDSILPFCYHRLNLDFGSVEGGGSALPAEPDVAPVNGGPDRTFEEISNATVEELPATGDPATAPAPTTPVVPADPNQRAGTVTAPAATAAEQWQSAREYAASQLGYQFPTGIADDAAALRHLVQQAAASRQSDFYSQLGRQIAPHAQDVQQYLQNRQPAAPAVPERQPWEAPEFDQRWVALVEQDPASGMYVSKPGADPIFAQKVNAYVEWKTDFDRNPAKAINGMVEQRAREIAKTEFQSQFAERDRQSQIQSIVQENSEWLYAVDQAGQRVIDPVTRNYVPSPLGSRYVYHVNQLRQSGVVDPRKQDQLAKTLVRGEYASYAQQSAATAAGQAANPQTQQAVGRPPVNPGQALPPTQRQITPGATEPSAVGRSLTEMLREAMSAEGITDAEFAHRD